MDNALTACPHCGSDAGAETVTTAKGGYVYFWDGEMSAEPIDQKVIRETIPRCINCGKRVPQILGAIDEARHG